MSNNQNGLSAHLKTLKMTQLGFRFTVKKYIKLLINLLFKIIIQKKTFCASSSDVIDNIFVFHACQLFMFSLLISEEKC